MLTAHSPLNPSFTRIRDSHFRHDAFGVMRVLSDGRRIPVVNASGLPARYNTLKDAKREASRLTLLEGFQPFAGGAIRYEVSLVAHESNLATKY